MISVKKSLGLLIVIVFAAASCTRRNAEPVKPLTMEEARARLLLCAPAPASSASGASNPSLAIQSVTLEPQATKVILTISAMNKAVEFHLPVYRLSSGRWLINGKGRAYLLDEECREYKLKDRKSLPRYEIPLEGRIALKENQRFEAVLVFPRVSDRSRVGMLVYDGRSFPFNVRP